MLFPAPRKPPYETITAVSDIAPIIDGAGRAVSLARLPVAPVPVAVRVVPEPVLLAVAGVLAELEPE